MTEAGGTDEVAARFAHLTEVLRKIADATTDYQLLLTTIADETAKLFNHVVAIRLVSDDKLRLEAVAIVDPVRGETPALRTVMATPIILGTGSALEAMLSIGKPQIITGITFEMLAPSYPPAVHAELATVDIRAFAFAPMIVHGDTIGAIFVAQCGDSMRPIIPADLPLVDGLAKHAALSIASSRMFADLKVAHVARELKKAIIDAVPHPLLVVDAEGNVRTANETFLQLFDLRAAEAFGSSVFDLANHALDTPAIRDALADLPTRVEAELFVNGIGRAFVIESRPIALPGPPFALLSFEDVTVLRRRAYVIEVMNEAVVMLDRDFRILDWNPAAETLFGWTAIEVIGREVRDVFAVQGIDREKTRSDARAGATVSSQMRARHRSGHWIDIEFSTVPITTSSGTAGFVAVLQDVTERVRLEREAAQRVSELEFANEELESFSYSVSHDLRTPVRAIEGFSKILQEDHFTEDDAEALRLLGIVRKNAMRLGTLLDDLLGFSRLGRKALVAGDVDMNPIVKDVVDGACRSEVERSFDVRIAPLPPARADAGLIEQVWANLIGNAVKYTRDRKPAVIEISGETNEIESVYRVTDNGVGFDMRYAEKLFGVFQRLHKEAEFPGTGVGLALVDRIVRRHGGRVWAEATPGKGASFYFSLPATTPSSGRTRTSPAGT